MVRRESAAVPCHLVAAGARAQYLLDVQPFGRSLPATQSSNTATRRSRRRVPKTSYVGQTTSNRVLCGSSTIRNCDTILRFDVKSQSNATYPASELGERSVRA
uniref:Uncharacterized protein n=1 Tax=Hyaloperonospora arabidopsidis (strain Emoy2) TaxID=559515 RepID=M4BMJ2_HYAAE